MPTAITTDNLTKQFCSHIAVDKLTLSIEEGSVFGFLGPNGSGKTTTVRLLTGLLQPTEGKATVMGLNVAAQGNQIRKLVGVQTDTNVYESLTAYDNLVTWGKFYDVPENKLEKRTNELLEFFGLTDRKNDQVGTFSKGMRQKLLVARALLHDPEVLFLDEPTSGLDPEAAQDVIQYLKQYISEGKRTVFYCSHRLEEVELLCKSIAIIYEGKLKANGTIAELRSQLWPTHTYSIELGNPDDKYTHLLEQAHLADDISLTGHKLQFSLKDQALIAEIVKDIVEHNGQVHSVEAETHSLKDIYFKIIPHMRREIV